MLNTWKIKVPLPNPDDVDFSDYKTEKYVEPKKDITKPNPIQQTLF